MTTKRARLIVFVMLVAIAVMLIVGWYMPVSADMVGPPTVETLLQNINSSITILQWAMGIIGTLLVYIYKSGNNAIMREVAYADSKAQVSIEKSDELEVKFDHEKDRVNKDFMTVQAHKQICGGANGHH